jgi:hypothetical protein
LGYTQLCPEAVPCRGTVRTFNVVYEDAVDGWVYAHVPELPEVHTQGETLDQAREMVKEAILPATARSRCRRLGICRQVGVGSLRRPAATHPRQLPR